MKYLKLILLINAMLTFLACELKDPNPIKQRIGDLDNQNGIPLTSNLTLFTNEGGASFEGAFILWNQDVYPQTVSNIQKISAKRRRTEDHTLLQLEDELTQVNTVMPQVRVLEDEKLELGQALGVLKAEAAVGLIGGFGNWLKEDFVRSLPEQDLNQEDVELSLKIFDLYCEAKIWEYAVDKNRLLAATFIANPTPNALCQEVYTRLNLLQPTAEVCAPSEAGETKDYFACIWQEGIFKTSFFNNLLDENQRKAMSILVDGPGLVPEFGDPGQQVAVKESLKDIILDSGRTKIKNFLRLRRLLIKDVCCEKPKKDSSGKRIAYDDDATKLTHLTPFYVLELVEDFEDSGAFKFFPGLDKEQELFKILSSALEFGKIERISGFSVNDVVFNDSIAKADGKVGLGINLNEQLEQIKESTDVIFSDLFNTSVELEAAIAQAQADLAEIDLKIKGAIEPLDFWRSESLDRQNQVIGLVQDIETELTKDRDRSIHGLYTNFQLNLKQTSETLEVIIRFFPGANPLYGCFNFATEKMCHENMNLREGTVFDFINHNQETGLLKIQRKLVEPSLFGFNSEIAGAEGAIHNLSDEDVIGLTMDLELFYSKKDLSLNNILTGNFTLLGPGDFEVYSGSISLTDYFEQLDGFESEILSEKSQWVVPAL